MALLTGISGIAAAVGGLSQIINALFPNQIKILIVDTDETVEINAVTQDSISESIIVSEQPSEDNKVFVQNISKEPRIINLSCHFSNILTLSSINSLKTAAQFGAALAVPVVAGLSNTLLNQEDSIKTRLRQLKNAKNNGLLVQVIGLPDQDFFEFIITEINETGGTETGTQSRQVELQLREAFIVDREASAPVQVRQTQEIVTGFLDFLPAIFTTISGTPGVTG